MLGLIKILFTVRTFTLILSDSQALVWPWRRSSSRIRLPMCICIVVAICACGYRFLVVFQRPQKKEASKFRLLSAVVGKTSQGKTKMLASQRTFAFVVLGPCWSFLRFRQVGTNSKRLFITSVSCYLVFSFISIIQIIHHIIYRGEPSKVCLSTILSSKMDFIDHFLPHLGFIDHFLVSKELDLSYSK